MKRLLLLSLIVFTFSNIKAQDYNHSFGLRAGIGTSGASYRNYLSPESSLRFMISSREKGVELTFLKEQHRYQLFEFCDELTLIYGIGAHVGYQKWDEVTIDPYKPFLFDVEKKTKPVAGLDALIGLEYHLWEAPISFGLELKPFFDVWGKEGFESHLFDLGLTVRINFN